MSENVLKEVIGDRTYLAYGPDSETVAANLEHAKAGGAGVVEIESPLGGFVVVYHGNAFISELDAATKYNAEIMQALFGPIEELPATESVAPWKAELEENKGGC